MFEVTGLDVTVVPSSEGLAVLISVKELGIFITVLLDPQTDDEAVTKQFAVLMGLLSKDMGNAVAAQVADSVVSYISSLN